MLESGFQMSVVVVECVLLVPVVVVDVGSVSAADPDLTEVYLALFVLWPTVANALTSACALFPPRFCLRAWLPQNKDLSSLDPSV